MYPTPLWGGAEQLQILQNRAAICIKKHSLLTPIWQMLNQCNWMSAFQLIQNHIILQTQKVLERDTYLVARLVTNLSFKTRQATGGEIRQTAEKYGTRKYVRKA